MKAWKEVTTRASRCSLSPRSPNILAVDWEDSVLWNTEIASAALEKAQLSTGYWESDCDNEVIKR